VHLVIIDDPWFGAYYKLSGLPTQADGAPVTFTIGPLYRRSIRIESIRTGSKSAQTGQFNEKPTQHTYVEGTITGSDRRYDGSIPDRYRGDIVTGFCDAEGKFEFREDEISLTHEYEWTQKLTESDDKADLAVAITYRSSHDDMGVLYSTHVEVKLTCDREEDDISGSVNYGTLLLVSALWEDNPIQDIILEQVPNPYGSGTSPFDADAFSFLLMLIEGEVSKALSRSPSKTVRDEAFFAALEDVSPANINYLENFRDILELGETIKSIRNFLDIPKTPKEIAKYFANLHLFWKYVVKTSLMDFHEVCRLMSFLAGNWGNLLKRIKTLDLIGRGDAVETHTVRKYIPVRITHNVKVCYGSDTSSPEEISALMSLLGATPKLGDLWDMVPYSFVLDWLIPIGDAIYNLERMNAAQQLPFKYMLWTTKTEGTINRDFGLSGHRFTMSLRVVKYERRVITKFPPDVWLGIRFHDPRKQLVTGGALIIQTLK